MVTKLLIKLGSFIQREKRLPTIQEIIRGLNLKMEKMPLPTFIQIEPTTKCNFNCIMCTRKTLNQKRLNKDLTLEEFKEILRQIPTVRKIKLQGLGEPLMNPYLHEIVAYGRELGISFTTTVNGSLLSGRNLEMILQFFDEVVISLDTTDRERYSMIRGHKMYDDIIKNIKECVKRKRETMRRINIGINSVISHLNYDEIPKLVELSKSLGVDYISIVEVENWKIPTEKGYVYEASFINKAREVKQKIHEYVEMCRKEGFTIYFSSSEKRKLKCRWPFDSCFITVDGYVTPCCIRMDPEAINFGNIFEKPFKKIWNSEKYRMFRRSMIRNLPNPCCDNCPD